MRFVLNYSYQGFLVNSKVTQPGSGMQASLFINPLFIMYKAADSKQLDWLQINCSHPLVPATPVKLYYLVFNYIPHILKPSVKFVLRCHSDILYYVLRYWDNGPAILVLNRIPSQLLQQEGSGTIYLGGIVAIAHRTNVPNLGLL